MFIPAKLTLRTVSVPTLTGAELIQHEFMRMVFYKLRILVRIHTRINKNGHSGTPGLLITDDEWYINN